MKLEENSETVETRTVTGQISRSDLLDLLSTDETVKRALAGAKVKLYSISVAVPTGGDFSGLNLEIGKDVDIKVEIIAEITKS